MLKVIKASLSLLVFSASFQAHAAVTVTSATGGTNLSADKAQNASVPGFTTLGNIVIQENANTDFSTPGGTLVLGAPTGWRFNPGVGTAARQSGNRDMADPTISVTESAITVTFSIGGIIRSDRLTISGIQVQATNGAALPSSGTIVRAASSTATISGITAATSFGSLSQVVGVAKNLAIGTEPSAISVAGVAFAQQPTVRVLDQFNNLRSAANGGADNTTVVTAGRLDGSGTLQGALTATANNGVATFSGLFHTVANPITLQFTSGALTAATSQQITVQPNSAAQLKFITEPGNAVVGTPFGTQPAIRTLDLYGNESTSNLGANVPVTVALTSGSGVLLGTPTLDIGTSAGNGEVTFTDLQIDAGSADKRLTASAPGLASGLSAVFTVQKQSQEITFGPLAGKTYGDSSFAVSAAASSLLPVSFQIAAGPASISGNSITITGAGDVTVRATQLGNDFYDVAAPVDQTFSVARATLQVSADNASRTYGAANPPFTTQFSGFVNGDTVSVISGAPSLTTAASEASLVSESPFSIVAAQGTLTADNYSFSFVNGELTITPAFLTVTPDNVQRAYGANNPVLTGSLGGIQNADNLTATYLTTATAADPVGTYPIELDALLDPDGKLANYLMTTNSSTLTIVPASLVVAVADASRSYGSENPTFTGEITGLQNGDVISGTYDNAATLISPVGTYPIGVTLEDLGSKLPNYSVTTNNGALTITPAALVVSTDNATRVYGSANPAFTGNISGLLNDDAITATYSTVATESSGVGSYPIVPTLNDPNNRLGNYSVTSNDGALIITSAALVVSADNASRVYGSANPTFTGSISGVLNDDGITATYSTVATESSGVGSYSIVPTLNDPNNRLGNYSVTSNDGALTITAADLVVSADNASRAYGSANPTFTGSVTGVANDDGITASYSTIATESSAVGSYPIVPTLNDPNNRLANYSVTSNDGELTITTAALVVSADNASRAYGSANPTFTGSVTGAANDDGITATYSTLATETSGVGNYSIVPSLNDPNNRLGNYSVTSNDGELTITAAALVVSADNASRAYGSANPTFSGSITGVVNEDGITATYSTVATETSPVGSYAIIPSLVDPNNRLANYSVTSNDGALTITAAALVVSADNASRAYGSANPTFTGSVTGVVNDDGITASYSTVATESSPVGSYSIVPTLNDPNNRLGNYSITSNDGTLTITASSLIVSADDLSRAYGAANPTLTGNISGVATDDGITVTYSTVATETSAVGSYPIVPTLNDPNNRLGNYSVATNNGTLTITAAVLVVSVDDASRAYGSANPTFTGSVSGVMNDDGITATYSTAATESSAVGDYAIVPSINDPNNRLGNYSVTSSNGTLTITTAALVVSANNATRAYGSANPEFSGDISGLLNGDAISATFSTAATESSAVGDYPIVPTFTDLDGRLENYSVVTNGTLSITAAELSVTPGNATRTYGDSNPAFSGSVVGILNSDNITADYTSDAVPADPVGTYDIGFALADPDNKLGNYNVVTNTGTLTITTAPLTATAHNKTKLLGTANPVLTGDVTGLKNADNISLVLETTATESSPVGNYPITISGFVDPDGKLGNYTVASNPGTLSILGLPVIVNLSGPTIVDEGATVNMQVQAEGDALEFQWTLNGDVISEATTSSYIIENVRTNQAGTYSVTISNEFGSDSASIVLQVTDDALAPQLKVLSPGNNKIYTNALLVANGTASDLVRVASVQYSLNDAVLAEVNNKLSAGKVTNWNAEVTLTPGTNSLYFVATDLAGNSTTSAVVKCIYNTASPLTIITNGTGAVLNPTAAALYSGNNTNLFVGRSYKLTALETGAPQWILTNWTDGNGNVLQTNNLTVNFIMEENMVVNANFIPNPFYTFGGVYNGLFSDTNGVAYESAGFLTLKVSPKMSFSGKLFLNGNTLPVSGKFRLDGTATVSTKDRFKKFEKPEVSISIALDFAGATKTLTGSVAQGTDWVAALQADKVVWTNNLVDLALAYTNSYTMLLPGFTNKNEGPVGTGFGAVTIDPIGKIKLNGQSADGHKLKQITVVSKDGAWPVFAPLYKQARLHSVTAKKITETKGFVLGWLHYQTNGIGNMAPVGNLNWISTGSTNIYGGGFTNQNIEVIGSRWLAPIAKGVPALAMTNVVLAFSEGNLSAPFQAEFLVSTNTTIVPLKTEIYPHKVRSALVPKTGVFKSTFVHPETLLPTKYAGALLQDYSFGSGFFVGATESGRVELDPIVE